MAPSMYVPTSQPNPSPMAAPPKISGPQFKPPTLNELLNAKKTLKKTKIKETNTSVGRVIETKKKTDKVVETKKKTGKGVKPENKADKVNIIKSNRPNKLMVKTGHVKGPTKQKNK